MNATDFDAITQDYQKLRAAERALTVRYKEQKAALDAAMENIEGVLLAALNDANVNAMNTDHVTFYKELVVKPSASDWGALYAWIKQTDAFEALEKRITKTFITTFMAQHKDKDGNPLLPPGVQVFREYVCRVRKREKDAASLDGPIGTLKLETENVE